MKKKLVSIILSSILICGSMGPSAMALNYTGRQGNQPTFETLEETRVNSISAVQYLETNEGKEFISHPILDGYAENTTFVYRSANLFGGRAAARLNTNLLVFAEQHFEDKDAAMTYLKELGVIDIIDQAVGSVVLVTPANGSTFGDVDQKNYYALQTAMLSQRTAEYTTDGRRLTYSDAEYFGGYGYIYVIGIDGGATFLNNYVSNTFDYVSRIAGMLLIGGNMDVIRNVATLVPTYMVNVPENVKDKYLDANEVNAFEATDEVMVQFNQDRPLQRVVTALTEKTNADYVHDAYYNMFIKAMRVPVVQRGLYTAGTPYQGTGFDQAPYSLCDRNAVIDDVTADGIHVVHHKEERFSEYKDPDNGEYLQTWFEYLPEEVLNNTAAPQSVPLILANHGGSDDPRLFVDEQGLLTLAGQERLAIVAPEHQDISGEYREVEITVLPLLTRYMLKTYPALDPSRVYAIGYSMGGSATLKAIYGDPSLYAAVVAMSPVHGLGEFYEPKPEVQDLFNGIELPIMLHTSRYDLGVTVDPATQTIAERFQKILNRVIGYNHLETIDNFDFEAYPTVGFKADKVAFKTLNNEYGNTTWYLNNKDGVPMVAVNFTEGLVHALYPEYAKVGWDFMKHYSRDVETGAIVYDPYVR